MRTFLTPAAFGIAAILISIPPAVGAAPPDNGGGVQMDLVDASDPEAAIVRRTGETATSWLGAKMVYEINGALAKLGVEGAVAICHLKSVSTPGQVLPGMPSVKAFKRTSLRLLNSANAPDAAEQLVLGHVKRLLDAGETPDQLFVQRITAPDGSIEWRVYRVLAVMPNCVACHGDPATQSPRLQTLLREKAPPNEATGYSVGEWRGLLRVTIATPPGT